MQQAAVQVGGNVSDEVDLETLPVQSLDLCLDIPRRRRKIVEAASALNPARNQLRVTSKKPK